MTASGLKSPSERGVGGWRFPFGSAFGPTVPPGASGEPPSQHLAPRPIHEGDMSEHPPEAIIGGGAHHRRAGPPQAPPDPAKGKEGRDDPRGPRGPPGAPAAPAGGDF